MTKHQILMLRRHLKVVCAAYEQMLARPDCTPSEKALITEALENARATLLGLDDLKPND